MVVFGAFAAVLIYAAYWAKNKAITTAKDYGIDFPRDAHARKGRASATRSAILVRSSRRRDGRSHGDCDHEQHTEDRTCNFASADGTGRWRTLEFSWGDGKILMTATRAGGKLMAMGPGTQLQAVTDVGDEAYPNAAHGQEGR